MFKTIPLACLLVCALLARTSFTQVTADTAQGQSPYGVYQVGDIDDVNVVNGNLSLHIPLLSYPQLGKDLRMEFSIYFNDKKWFIGNFRDVLQANGQSYWEGQWTGPIVQYEPTPPMVGAYIARNQDVVFGQDVQTQSYTVGAPPSEYAVTTNFYGQYVIEANGAKHYIGDSETQTCQVIAGGNCPTVYSGYGAAYPATDGTDWPYGLRYVIANNNPPTTITEADTNGNQIVTSGSGWSDTIGRNFPGSQSGPGAEYQTSTPGVTVPGNRLDSASCTS